MHCQIHWLCPIETKHNSGVYKKLMKIYSVHGLWKKLCRKKHVREFAPLLKQKWLDVEHNTLSCNAKLNTPFFWKHLLGQGKTKKTCKELERICHIPKKREKWWNERKIPFKIYFGRKSNKLVNADITYGSIIYTRKLKRQAKWIS